MRVTPADIAKTHDVSWHTAYRWFKRAEEIGSVELQRVGRRLVADAKKLQPWIPPPKRKLIAVEEAKRAEAQVLDFQRRLDVEVRERLKLEERLVKLEKKVAAQDWQP